MNENEKVDPVINSNNTTGEDEITKTEENQNNEFVQSSKIDSQISESQIILETEKTTLNNEVVFSETDIKIEQETVSNVNNGFIVEEHEVINDIQQDIELPQWDTVKIKDDSRGYNYINNNNSDNNDVIFENSTNNIEHHEVKRVSNFNIKSIFKNKWFYIVIVFLLAIASFTAVLLSIINDDGESDKPQNNQQTNNTPTNTATPNNTNLARRKTDGVLVSKDKTNNWPFAVMIENSTDARPVSGVNEANIIYEVLAEGSITRFLAIYSSGDNISKIGPVRSARPYYVDIAEEYNSLYIHFGGSPEALDKLNKGYYNVVDFDGIIYDGKYFWRDNKRSAPHNAYISTDLINKYLSDTKNGEEFGNFSEWTFTDKKLNDNIDVLDLKKANNVNIKYAEQAPSYNVVWKYDEKTGNYIRYYATGTTDKDASGEKMTTKNIIIQFASTKVINGDDKLRKAVDLTEGGKAIMIRDGYSVIGYWKKNSLTNRTKFYTNINGVEKEFEFGSGKIWVNVIPKENDVNIY